MKNLKILILLSSVSFVFLLYGLTEKWHFSAMYYLGLCSITVNFIFYLWAKKYFKYAFGITLFFGLTGLIHFFPFKMGLHFFGITIQTIPFLFFLLFCYVNREHIFDLIFTPNNEEENEFANQKKEIFRNQFEQLSESELKDKLNQPLVQEAIEVINEILKNRKATR